MDGYDYFGDEHSQLSMPDGKELKKQLSDKDYSIREAPIQYIPRDRLVRRQTYAQDQRVQGQNKSIILNDGSTDRLIIGYSKGAF